MEKNKQKIIFSGILASLAFLLFLVCSDTAIEYMKKGLKLCVENVVPSLFPFMVISELLVQSGFGNLSGNIIGKPFKLLFGVSKNSACAFILGLLCGFPMGASVLCGMYDQKEIGEAEFSSAMTFCNNPGAAFVINTVGLSFFGSKRLGIILYLSVVSSAILVGFFGKFFKKNKKSLSGERPLCILQNEKSISKLFTSAMIKALTSVLTVCAYVTFFSSLVGCLGRIVKSVGASSTISAALFGFFEISSGVSMASTLGSRALAILLCSATLGWSGLSVHLQIATICHGRIDMRPYFFAKLAQSVLCAAIACCLSVTVL